MFNGLINEFITFKFGDFNQMVMIIRLCPRGTYPLIHDENLQTPYPIRGPFVGEYYSLLRFLLRLPMTYIFAYSLLRFHYPIL